MSEGRSVCSVHIIIFHTRTHVYLPNETGAYRQQLFLNIDVFALSDTAVQLRFAFAHICIQVRAHFKCEL